MQKLKEIDTFQKPKIMVSCRNDMVQIQGALTAYKKRVEAVNRNVTKEGAFQNLAIF